MSHRCLTTPTQNRCSIPLLILALALFALVAAPPALADLRINEIGAVNGGPLVDEDGEESDWIEIHNLSSSPANLDGWYLTDNASVPTKWQFPSVEIPGDGYLLVFASAKNRVSEEAELHTSFKLDGDGEYLALVEPNGTTVHHAFSPQFPTQFVGISYGLADNLESLGYFTIPSPGGPNGPIAFDGFIEEAVEFDVTRGFFDSPFEVTLTTAANEARIYYTTDSSLPDPVTGTLYDGPIPIATTTVLRAGVYRSGEAPVSIATQSYIFLDDVLDQPASPPGFPSTWQPTVSADYAMDDDLRIGTSEEIKQALLALPTVSLSMEVDDWFHPSTNPAIGGIYSNSAISFGPEWEREVSAEFFGFPHGQETQVDCGVRIFGNASRRTDRAKHNIRLIFRRSYGPAKIEFPLFGDDVIPDSINGYMLRGQNGDSWIHPSAGQRTEALYLRDQLARDLQRKMNQPNTRQDHVHLYINGLYWGLFNTIERIEADSMSENYGGPEEEWDVIKSSRVSGMEVVDGSMDIWTQVQTMANSGISSPEEYEAIQEFIDLENFVDWLLVNFWNGNSDWDDNNFQIARRKRPGETFRFFVWDSERSLLSVTANNTGINFPNRGSRIHSALRANPEYRLFFADRIHRHFFHDGALTPDAVRDLFGDWVEKMRIPLLGESARWGDTLRPGNPYRVDNEWQNEVNFQNNSYMATRAATVLAQFRNQGLYPSIEAPAFNQHGGAIASGFELTMSAPEGIIYYTLDGSDPRQPEVQGVETVLLDEGAPAKAFVPLNGTLGDSWKLSGFDDSAWQQGSTGVGAETIPDNFANLIGLPVSGVIGVNGSVYIRIPFSITDQASVDEIEGVVLDMKYDDGFVASINGIEVAASNPPQGDIEWNSIASASRSDSAAVVFEEFDASNAVSSLQPGENILAIQLLNSSIGNSDLLALPRLTAFDTSPSGISQSAIAYDGNPITLPKSSVASARVVVNGEWSALNRAEFRMGAEPASANNLAISEIQYRPGPGNPGGEWIELTNIGEAPVDLRGVRFMDGILFDFSIDSELPLLILEPGEHLVVVSNRENFLLSYPNAAGVVAGEFVGDLENDGERLILLAADSSTIRNFRFNDRHPWPEAPDGDGFTLVLVAPETNPDHTVGSHWRSSVEPGGSPGSSDASSFPGGSPEDFFSYASGVSDSSAALLQLLPGNELLLSFPQNLAADDVLHDIESSRDLVTWQNARDDFARSAVSAPEEGTVTVSYTRVASALWPGGEFYRVRFRER